MQMSDSLINLEKNEISRESSAEGIAEPAKIIEALMKRIYSLEESYEDETKNLRWIIIGLRKEIQLLKAKIKRDK